MGLGLIFVGFMFLYDFQTALQTPATGEVYMLIDIFPDLIGWLLLFFGLRLLCRAYPKFCAVRNFCIPMACLSVVTLLGDTVFYSAFYPGGYESVICSAIHFAENLLVALFCFFLFRRMAQLAEGRRECPKLASSFRLSQGFAVTDGILYLAAFFTGKFLPESLLGAVKAISACYYLFWIFFIWYNVILLFRAYRKITD